MRAIPEGDIEEREANYFAMCLLMPEKFVREEIAKMGGSIDLADDKQIRILANKFQVSIAMMTVRLGQLAILV